RSRIWSAISLSARPGVKPGCPAALWTTGMTSQEDRRVKRRLEAGKAPSLKRPCKMRIPASNRRPPVTELISPPKPGIEAKVQAGTLSAVVGGIAVYLLQTYAFRGDVPAGIVSLIYAAVPGLLALAGGYLAPHSPRPLPPSPAPPSNVTITAP